MASPSLGALRRAEAKLRHRHINSCRCDVHRDGCLLVMIVVIWRKVMRPGSAGSDVKGSRVADRREGRVRDVERDGRLDGRSGVRRVRLNVRVLGGGVRFVPLRACHLWRPALAANLPRARLHRDRIIPLVERTESERPRGRREHASDRGRPGLDRQPVGARVIQRGRRHR